MMNKHIFYYLMVGSMALLLGACNDSMNCLLYTSPSPRD